MGEQILAKHSIGKLLFKYSVPAIIGMVVNALYNVIDRIFIGNIPDVGPLAITGLGITMPISTIILAFGMLVGIGTTANISIKLGQGKKDEAQKHIGNAVTLALSIGTILMVIGLLFSDNILNLFGASDSTIEYAKAYINIILLGTPVNMLAFSLNHSIRADGSPKVSAGIMITGCITNIVLDALFIFKFNMGIQGAATATIISQFLTSVMTLKYYTGGKSNLKLKKKNLKLDKKLVKGVFAIGFSAFAMQLAASLVQVIANNSLKRYGGDLAIGAMATVNSVSMMCLMPIFGLNQGAQPIVGFNYGAKQYERVKKTYLCTLLAATVILCIGAFFIQTHPEAIVGLFNKDEGLIEISAQGLKTYMLMIPITSLSITGTNFIQSIGKAKIAMFLSLLRQVILLIPAMLILPKFFGLGGIWMSQPIADLISTIIAGIIVFRELKSYNSISKNLFDREEDNYIIDCDNNRIADVETAVEKCREV